MPNNSEKLNNLRELHFKPNEPLLIPNVWDPISAILVESHGFKAIGTASAAISASLGFKDGEEMPFDKLISTLESILRVTNLPITADIESGYASDLSELENNINALIDLGIAGINIEDSVTEGVELRSAKEQSDIINCIRTVANQRNHPIVINARCDALLLNDDISPIDKILDTVSRANSYIQSGADCIYPIGSLETSTVKLLRSKIDHPINILCTEHSPNIQELTTLNINRISFGPALFRKTFWLLNKYLDEIKLGKTSSIFCDYASEDDVNGYLT